jgi:hypothetical protein
MRSRTQRALGEICCFISAHAGFILLSHLFIIFILFFWKIKNKFLFHLFCYYVALFLISIPPQAGKKENTTEHE